MSLLLVVMTGQAIVLLQEKKMTGQPTVLHLRMNVHVIHLLQETMKKDRLIHLLKEIMTPEETMTGLAILLHKETTIQAGVMTDQVILLHREVNHLLPAEALLLQAGIQVHLQEEVVAEVAAARVHRLAVN